MYVTYESLFQYTLVVIAIITFVCNQNNKRK